MRPSVYHHPAQRLNLRASARTATSVLRATAGISRSNGNPPAGGAVVCTGVVVGVGWTPCTVVKSSPGKYVEIFFKPVYQLIPKPD